jgi:hypothetical protein
VSLRRPNVGEGSGEVCADNSLGCTCWIASLQQAIDNDLNLSWNIEIYDVTWAVFLWSRETGFLPLFFELAELSHTFRTGIERIDWNVAPRANVVLASHFQRVLHVGDVIVGRRLLG